MQAVMQAVMSSLVAQASPEDGGVDDVGSVGGADDGAGDDHDHHDEETSRKREVQLIKF